MSKQSRKPLDKRGKSLKGLTDRNGVKTRRWTGRQQRDPREINATLGLRGASPAPAARDQASPTFRYLNERSGKKVCSDFRRFAETGDPGKLTKGLYHHLTMYGGHIAHYGIDGFRAHFAGDLSRLLAQARKAGARYVPAYDDSGYTDGLTANAVNEQLGEIAAELQEQVEEREQEAQKQEDLRLLQGLAAKHGLRVEPAIQELPDLADDQPLDLSPDAFLSGKTSRQLEEVDRRYEAEQQKGKLIEGWCVTEECDDVGDGLSRIGWGQFDGQHSGAAYETGIDPGSIHRPLRWETYDDDGGKCYAGVISFSWAEEGTEEQVFAPREFSTLDLGAVRLDIDGETM